MDLGDTPEEAAFRAEARAWLEAHARRKGEDDHGATRLFAELSPEEEARLVAEAKAWQRTKQEGGWVAVTWPGEWGGRGGTVMEGIIWGQEESRFDVPSGVWEITMGMIAPTIIVHGTPAQKAWWLPRILDGSEVWCQLYSEPGAGSDLGSLATRAERDGDEWIVSGQKVWTSGAHYAAWGYLLARTDPEQTKHRGITAFCLRMDSPGVTVKPLRQMTGGASFNEVFFDDVRVPADQMLGGENQGWSVAITTLMNERLAAAGIGSRGGVRMLVELARSAGAWHDPVVRQRVMRVYAMGETLRFTTYRVLSAISQGGIPGPEGSIGKLVIARLLNETAATVLQVLGPEGMLSSDYSRLALAAPGMRIAGGTDEVMRNIIGERVLGLPGEPRVDKGVSFREAMRAARA